jgi:hypothetical protein
MNINADLALVEYNHTVLSNGYHGTLLAQLLPHSGCLCSSTAALRWLQLLRSWLCYILSIP